MVSSYELSQWPNGIRLAYRQIFPCGHRVTIWSNTKEPVVMGSPWPGTHTDQYTNPALLERVKEMGCIKCVDPPEPVGYQHKGRGGFLKNLEKNSSLTVLSSSLDFIFW